jgi:septal ring factor EnvC (AmiA/AmiB activator)
MKRIVAPAIAGVLVLGLLTGCGAEEREALQKRVSSLQQELVTANNSLAAKESELTTLRAQLQSATDSQTQAAAEVAALTAELETVKADLAKAQTKKKK